MNWSQLADQLPGVLNGAIAGVLASATYDIIKRLIQWVTYRQPKHVIVGGFVPRTTRPGKSKVRWLEMLVMIGLLTLMSSMIRLSLAVDVEESRVIISTAITVVVLLQSFRSSRGDD